MGRLILYLYLLTFFLHCQVNCSSSFSSNSSSSQLCLHDQGLALLHFKNIFSITSSASAFCDEFLGVTSHAKILSWNENTDCCSWNGVRCDITGHVIGLNLRCSQLHGTIQPNSSLFLLTHLRWLNLSFNDFNHSRISSEFHLFMNLTHLDLFAAGFSAYIPPEISHLSKLVSFRLSGYYDYKLEKLNFKRLIQNLTKLRELSLHQVDMSLVELDSLRNLSSSLTSLDLFSCGLRGKFPDSIFHLPNLKGLNLAENYDLTGHFPRVNWSNPLDFLLISSTSFSGELPYSIGSIKSLHFIDLSNCSFFGSIPASLGNLSQLFHMSLSSNNFSGQIPSSLSKLKQLTSLDISDNRFNGSIPAWHGNLMQLQYLDLSFNNFSGQIPSCLGNLTQLATLDLSSNNFNGPILISLSKLGELSSLDFSYNHFSGLIPTWLKSLAECLEILDLSSNNFSGQIPSWLGNFTKLFTLDLSSNEFWGVEQLPWKKLQYLDLHSNKLQGSLPIPPLGTTFFSVSNNRLTGEISSLICNVSSLEILNLSNNNMSGIIPQCLGNFAKNLSVLDLRMNGFHGTIPKTFAKGNALRNLDFNGNKLEGPLPQSLINCTKLEVLDLGFNKVNDTFPYWLETLTELQVLVLRCNRFHGPIRDSKGKCSFPKLRILDLSDNDFSGPLPTRIIRNLIAMMNASADKIGLKYMGDAYYQDSVIVIIKGVEFLMDRILTIFTTIDLSNNKFQGEIPKSIGNLYSLRLLNFSHNNLTGYIPSSMANLKNLESLDLSSNNLIGEIPRELASLNFLSLLNLSQNHLEGPIPRGSQFNTFQNNSYGGNVGLCGFPLSKKCSVDEASQPSQFIPPEEDNPGFASGFEWKAALMGYGSGTVFGIVMGYFIFITGKPKWLVKMVEGKHYKVRRSKRNANRRGGRRN